MAPLIQIDAARIDRNGVPVLDGVSCVREGTLAVLLGDWSPLFDLMVGRARLVAGRVELAGNDANWPASTAKIGVGRRDLRLPSKWKLLDWLAEHVALVSGRGSSRQEARRILDALGGGALSTRRLEGLTNEERALFSIAQACVGSKPVLALECPFDGLDEAAALHLSFVLEQVRGGRPLLLSSGSARSQAAVRGWADRADAVLVLRGPRTIVAASDASFLPAARYALTVVGEVEALTATLAEQGIGVELSEPGTRAQPEEGDGPGVRRLVLEVPGGLPLDPILESALSLRLPVLKLEPLAAPLSSLREQAGRPAEGPQRP